MAIGRTFGQAFAKALRSRELDAQPSLEGSDEELLTRLESPSADRFDVLLELRPLQLAAQHRAGGDFRSRQLAARGIAELLALHLHSSAPLLQT